MAVRTQTAQEISMTRAGARSRRLRDNVAVHPRPEDRRVPAVDGDAVRVGSWSALDEGSVDHLGPHLRLRHV